LIIKSLKNSYKLNYIYYWNKFINLILILTYKKIPKKILEFGIVGCLGIMIQLIFFYSLNYFNNNDFVKNNFIAIIVGSIGGYYLNNLLTFNKNKLIGNKFISGMFKFLACSLLTISINIFISSVIYSFLKIQIISILAGIIGGFFSNFFISRKLVWRI